MKFILNIVMIGFSCSLMAMENCLVDFNSSSPEMVSACIEILHQHFDESVHVKTSDNQLALLSCLATYDDDVNRLKSVLDQQQFVHREVINALELRIRNWQNFANYLIAKKRMSCEKQGR